MSLPGFLPGFMPGGAAVGIILTAVVDGVVHNGDTITFATHDVAAILGFTGDPDTFSGGTGTVGAIADPEIQVQADYGEGFNDILGLTAGSVPGTATMEPVSDVAQIYDMGAPFNVPLAYRARCVAKSGSQTYISAWSDVLNL